MFGWKTILAMEERDKELRRAAERERLARQAQAEREGVGLGYRRALVWLGCALVVLGQHLQEHYSPAVEACVPTCPNCRI